MEKIYLRRLCKADINQEYLGWLNDPEVTKYMTTKSSTMEQLNAFYWQMQNSTNNVIFAIIESETGKHIGNIKIGSINWNDRTADIGIMIGEKYCWNKGYGTQAISEATKHACFSLLLTTLFASVADKSIGSIKAFTKAGFKMGNPSANGHWYRYKK